MYVLDGQKGVAKFAYDNMLKDKNGDLNYYCTDASTSSFKFRNHDGNIHKDINALKLTDKLVEAGINTQSSNLASKIWTNDDGTINTDKFLYGLGKIQEILNLKNDNCIFKNQLASLTSI